MPLNIRLRSQVCVRCSSSYQPMKTSDFIQRIRHSEILEFNAKPFSFSRNSTSLFFSFSKVDTLLNPKQFPNYISQEDFLASFSTLGSWKMKLRWEIGFGASKQRTLYLREDQKKVERKILIFTSRLHTFNFKIR